MKNGFPAKLIAAGLFLLGLFGVGIAQSTTSPQMELGQRLSKFEKKITVTVSAGYLLHLPGDYAKNKRKKWPLVLFLHGSGERGSDLNKVRVHGPPKLVDNGQDLPFILVSPQCPDGRWWDNDTLNALLDTVIKENRVDQDRVYCTGLSMGGFGTWALATAYPNRFAAIAPVCGGGDKTKVDGLKDLPIWVFHGGKDPVVNVSQSKDMVEALTAIGGNVKLTIYPEAGHDSWTETYNNPELFTWMLAQKRKKR